MLKQLAWFYQYCPLNNNRYLLTCLKLMFRFNLTVFPRCFSMNAKDTRKWVLNLLILIGISREIILQCIHIFLPNFLSQPVCIIPNISSIYHVISLFPLTLLLTRRSSVSPIWVKDDLPYRAASLFFLVMLVHHLTCTLGEFDVE
jgi:hypothetical protein